MAFSPTNLLKIQDCNLFSSQSKGPRVARMPYDEWNLWDDETYGDEKDIKFLLQPMLHDQAALKSVFKGLAEALYNMSASKDFDVLEGIESLISLRKNSRFTFLILPRLVEIARSTTQRSCRKSKNGTKNRLPSPCR